MLYRNPMKFIGMTKGLDKIASRSVDGKFMLRALKRKPILHESALESG